MFLFGYFVSLEFFEVDIMPGEECCITGYAKLGDLRYIHELERHLERHLASGGLGAGSGLNGFRAREELQSHPR